MGYMRCKRLYGIVKFVIFFCKKFLSPSLVLRGNNNFKLNDCKCLKVIQFFYFCQAKQIVVN